MPLDRLASAGLVAALAWNFAPACSSTSTNGSSSGGGSGATDAASGKGGGGVSGGGGAPEGGQGIGGVAGAGGISPDDSGTGSDALSEGGETCAACTQASCGAEDSACISDLNCSKCATGQADAGCTTLFDTLVSCLCMNCQTECSQECPGGGG